MGASESRPAASKLAVPVLEYKHVGEDKPVGENGRIKYAAFSVQGGREQMEDTFAAILDLDGSESASFFGVYDGHGGADVALYCKRQFHIKLVNNPDYPNNLANAMQDVCLRIDQVLEKSNDWREEEPIPESNGDRMKCLMAGACANVCRTKAPIGPQFEGSTACVVLIKDNQITVGNVGDSRCIISVNGQAASLSTDHKPEAERQRIVEAGGRAAIGRLGLFGVSRAIGDFQFKQNKKLFPAQQVMICTPDTRTVDITRDTEFLLIASHGIWNIMSNQEVVDFVRPYLLDNEDADLPATCQELLHRYMAAVRSPDNMTVILVQFKTCYRAGLPPPIANPSASASVDATAEIQGETQQQETEIEDPMNTITTVSASVRVPTAVSEIEELEAPNLTASTASGSTSTRVDATDETKIESPPNEQVGTTSLFSISTSPI